MTPKSLLRLPAATSPIDDLTEGCFHRVIGDAVVAAEHAERVLFCSGKIYYELVEERKRRGVAAERTMIVRLEQLYPFRGEYIASAVRGVSDAVDLVWVQDEPGNMGAGGFVVPRLAGVLGRAPRLVSRDDSASPATGSHKAHVLEQNRIFAAAFGG
jgi:2-oxoglutarate dehydrogenase E1 component